MAAAPPPPPPPLYLGIFLGYDFARRCQPDYFCCSCGRAICSHCCARHTATHHPQPQPGTTHFPRVRVFRAAADYPAVSYDGARGCGYKFDGIQRFRYGQETYVPLRRRPTPLGGGGNLRCSLPACQDRTPSRCVTCSIQCTLVYREGGNVIGRAVATAMVASNHLFLQHFDRDRFCTGCRTFYHSQFCDLHSETHHQGLADIITLVREDGRVLTPFAGALPHHVLHGVQVIAVGGAAMVQVIPSDQPLDGLVDGFGICLSDGCHSAIGDEFMSCSLLCQAKINGWVQ